MMRSLSSFGRDWMLAISADDKADKTFKLQITQMSENLFPYHGWDDHDVSITALRVNTPLNHCWTTDLQLGHGIFFLSLGLVRLKFADSIIHPH